MMSSESNRSDDTRIDHARYLLMLARSYEEEVAGEAYFRTLCDCFPRQRDFLMRCVKLEHDTAELLSPLIRKYQLAVRPHPVLILEGTDNAALDAGQTWPDLLQESIDYYPHYVEEFRTLERLGPVEDQAILEKLTRHERLLIEWLCQARSAHAQTGA